MCQNERKTDVKQHQLFNHIFNTHASTPSQAFNLSNTLKIIELKDFCMPVSATQVCFNVSQSVVCISKSTVYLVPVYPNLPLYTALYNQTQMYEIL